MAVVEAPFLYQTRTIMRRFSTLSRRRYSHQTHSSPAGAPVEEKARKLPVESKFIPEKSAHSTSHPEQPVGSRTSTITGPEHKAFQNLVRGLQDKRRLPVDGTAHGVRRKQRVADYTNHEKVLAMFSRPVPAHRGQHGTSRDAPRTEDIEDAEIDASPSNPHMLRYPQPLQRTALGPRESPDGSLPRGLSETSRHSTSLAESDHTTPGRSQGPRCYRPSFLNAEGSEDGPPDQARCGPTPTEQHDLVDHVSNATMAHIANAFEAGIDSAEKSTERAIWETCERLVFPLVFLLQTSKAPESTPQPELPEARMDSADLGATGGPTQDTSTILRLPADVAPLHVISRVYPAALLLALRLYRAHAPTSPWALGLLPHLRALGPTSYVLGGTIQFYNTLMKLKWDVYSDLRGLNDLLLEMERAGIEFDVETHQVLVDIGAARWLDLARPADEAVPRGRRHGSWWQRPEQERWFRTVGVEWKQVIAGRLRDQGRGDLISEREYGDSPPRLGSRAGAVQGEAAPVVWL